MKRPRKKFHVKTGDQVKVITGEYKGMQGVILKVIRKKDRVFVDSVPKMKKAVKPTQEKPEGGYVEINRPIHVSNVAKVDVEEKKPAAKKAAKKKTVEKKK